MSQQVREPPGWDGVLPRTNLDIPMPSRRSAPGPAVRESSDAQQADPLRSLTIAADYLVAEGDPAAAEPLYRRALEICERLLGPEHPDTLQGMTRLANCLQAKGDPEAAEPLLRRALAAAERVLGPEHPGTVLYRDNLAGLLRRRGG